MTSYLEYRLVHGFVHNWLVAGPLALPIQHPQCGPGDPQDRRGQVYQGLPETARRQALDLSVPPLDRARVEAGGARLAWRYQRCMDDHLVDLSASYPLWTHVCAWAYTTLWLPSAQPAVLEVTASGPVEVWLNGRLVHRGEDFPPGGRAVLAVPVELVEGENQVLVRFETVGVGACPLALALRLAGLPQEVESEVTVRLATQARYPQRHQTLEETFERAYLEEVVNHRGAHVNLRWGEAKGPKMKFAYQIQDKEGWVFVEGSWETDTEKPVDIGHGFRLKERPYFVSLRAILLEYVEHNLRYEKKFPLYVTDNAYSSVPTGDFAGRNREALEDAAKYTDHLFGVIAGLALGGWADFKPDLVLEHVQQANRREAGSETTVLGLLGLLYRYGSDPRFPEALRQPLEECLLNYRYWQDEGPDPVQACDGLEFEPESSRLVFHACQALAGQLYPRHTFACGGETGQRQREKGERLALDWLRRRGAWGFQDWDSNDTFEKDLLALSHLASLAEDVTLRELAAVMMDKVFFSMAVNSYKGAFGSTHGRTAASMLKSAQLEATSGIARMMWGTGVYNAHILGTVSLATSSYEFPLLIGEIANDTDSTVWNRERHVVDPEQGLEVNKVTYKTPDYMLCSAQDYRPGQRGQAEHVWQATLGPDALVFTNHPACFSDADEHRPGFWLGNAWLPRVAQWKDVLVAVYHLPADDWMGFTHAYFPLHQFTEHEIHAEGGQAWAFARKDDGYLALTASRGFELVRRAPDGYRELRSYGLDNVWLCHMGRAETDGSFERFKKRILALKLEWLGLEVRLKSLRGEYLSFGWEGPLLVNGKEKPLRGYKHHESPYSVVDLPAAQMDIQSRGTVMRLDFS
jgi:hypothetical protein